MDQLETEGFKREEENGDRKEEPEA